MPKEIPFKCPSCGHGFYEEVQVDITVATTCRVEQHDNGFEIVYGDATNSDGYVDRYQCCGCGYTIVDHNSPHTEDGLDELALVAALKQLSVPPQKGELVSRGELVHRIVDGYDSLSGEELVALWNELFPATPVVYEGDSLYWMKE